MSKTEMTPFEARTLRLQALSRIIAAEKMDMVDDPLGGKLPPELWLRQMPLAVSVQTLLLPAIQ